MWATGYGTGESTSLPNDCTPNVRSVWCITSASAAIASRAIAGVWEFHSFGGRWVERGHFRGDFFRELDIRGAARELMRNIVNAGQLRFGFRVRRAMKSAASVMAANREVASDVTKVYGVTPRVQLETGIAQVRTAPRSPRDPSAPLKILWAGRLRSWKALPLLLRALAELPADCRYTLRVMGQGNCRNRWTRLATRLGDRVARRVGRLARVPGAASPLRMGRRVRIHEPARHLRHRVARSPSRGNAHYRHRSSRGGGHHDARVRRLDAGRPAADDH